MSIEVMALVWKVTRLPSGRRVGKGETLVLLALADWSDDRGGNIYPSLRSIAAKARCTTRSVSRILGALEDEELRGERLLEVSRPAAGDGRSSNRYRLNLDVLAELARPGRTNYHPRGVSSVTPGVSPVSPDPSSDPPSGSSPSAGDEDIPCYGGRASTCTKSPKATGKKRTRADAPATMPSSLGTAPFLEVWGEFRRYRAREMHKPMSAQGERRMLAKLEPYGAAAATDALRDAMANGYAGVFPRHASDSRGRHVDPDLQARIDAANAFEKQLRENRSAAREARLGQCRDKEPATMRARSTTITSATVAVDACATAAGAFLTASRNDAANGGLPQ